MATVRLIDTYRTFGTHQLVKVYMVKEKEVVAVYTDKGKIEYIFDTSFQRFPVEDEIVYLSLIEALA